MKVGNFDIKSSLNRFNELWIGTQKCTGIICVVLVAIVYVFLDFSKPSAGKRSLFRNGDVETECAKLVLNLQIHIFENC